MRVLRMGLFLLTAVAAAAAVPRAPSAQIGVSITVAPPALPVYVQPPIPAPGYIWTPGHWAWGPGEYFWVPGTWVQPPVVGVLWTPGYWGWHGGVFAWNGGYWGPHVGFYGGINYGFGYVGVGYAGGYWNNGNFFYNRTVNNISNTRITNVYNRPVTAPAATASRASFNGPGGVAARPTPAEEAAAHEQHTPETPAQVRNREAAAADPRQRASVNHGNPAVAATAHPGELKGPGVVAAHGAPPEHAGPAHAAEVHAPEHAAAVPGHGAPGPGHPGGPEHAAAVPGHVAPGPGHPGGPVHAGPVHAGPVHAGPVAPGGPHPAIRPHPVHAVAPAHPAAVRRPPPARGPER